MDKPIKPNVDLPDSFGGVKSNFSTSKILNGYEKDIPDILGGANLNYLLDTWGQRQTYYDTIVDFVNALPIGKFITTDNNNKLVYADMQKYTKRGIGETIFSLLPLTSSDLHLLDGGILSNGIYSEFYSYIVGLYTGGTCPNCFCTEEQWQASVSQYGACAKFVINSANQTIRLPRIVGMTEGTIDINSLTDLEEAGLPNITGKVDGNVDKISTLEAFGECHYEAGNTSLTGAFTPITAYQYATADGAAAATMISGFNFDASLSNSIYGNSSTVQPQTVKGFYYIVIANTQADSYTLQLDDVATDLNNKADKATTLAGYNIADGMNTNASNATSTAMATITSWGMPDYANKVAITGNTMYQASKDGIILVTYTNPYIGYMHIKVSDVPDLTNIYTIVAKSGDDINSNTKDGWGFGFVPKDYYYYVYLDSIDMSECWFIPLKGA